jgi:hypothetical protein
MTCRASARPLLWYTTVPISIMVARGSPVRYLELTGIMRQLELGESP